MDLFKAYATSSFINMPLGQTRRSFCLAESCSRGYVTGGAWLSKELQNIPRIVLNNTTCAYPSNLRNVMQIDRCGLVHLFRQKGFWGHKHPKIITDSASGRDMSMAVSNTQPHATLEPLPSIVVDSVDNFDTINGLRFYTNFTRWQLDGSM